MINKKTDSNKTDRQFRKIINIPIRNLEKRINEIQKEIEMRRLVHDSNILGINNHQTKLKGKLDELKYSSPFQPGFSQQVTLLKEIGRSEIRKADELITYFRDTSKLKEQLREAKEQIRKQRVKKNLLNDN